jgi:hypothetical protein
MAHVIRAIAFANGVHCPHAGQWVKSFDHEAYDGRGFGTFTKHIEDAMPFADFGAAMDFWRRQSAVRPVRPDGKPNRPMTGLTIVVETLP